MFFLLVAGSRTFWDYKLLCDKLDFFLKNKKEVTIVSGHCPHGADALAEKYAYERGIPLKLFPANWNKYGKRAGFVRNEEMHKFISNQKDRGVVLFWDGKSLGTKHSFSLAQKYNNKLKVVLFS